MTNLSMQIERELIQDGIKRSFATSMKPTFSIAADTNILEAAQIRDFFIGKRWEDISLYRLRYDYVGDPSACFSFMTLKARQYYLPAYMLASLEDYHEADLIVDSTIDLLDPNNWCDNEPFAAWRNGFTSDQCKSIQRFALFLKNYHSDDFDDPDSEMTVLDRIIDGYNCAI